jgi:hypothetical protein
MQGYRRRLVAMRGGSVRAERQRATVVACLHVRANDAQLRVGRVQHGRRALESGQCTGRVAARQTLLGCAKQRRAFAQRRFADSCNRTCMLRSAGATSGPTSGRRA